MSAARASTAGGRRRLDQLLVERGLAPSRERARALCLAGRVLVDGERRDKPGHAVPAEARVELAPGAREYASRGAHKLAAALDELGVDPSGSRCLDVGASTGGFTDLLLARGAAHVTALDVGRGLIDQKLRDDPRVLVVEGVNARYLEPEEVAPPYELVTADLSFISLRLVVPRLAPLAPAGRLLLMVKPQFEVGREAVGKGGVVRERGARVGALEAVSEALMAAGLRVEGVRAAGLRGPKGNREVFLLAGRGEGLGPAALEQAIAREVDREEP